MQMKRLAWLGRRGRRTGVIFDARREAKQYEQLASRRRAHGQQEPTEGFCGTTAWWAAVDDGTVPVRTSRGRVVQTVPASMHTFPEFTITLENGAEQMWPARTRSLQRLRVGDRVEVIWVMHDIRPLPGRYVSGDTIPATLRVTRLD